MSNEHFLNPDPGRRHKGVHLCRRLQKLDKGGQRKRLKWKTHQQAKNIIKQNQTSIFARILAFGPSKRMSQHLSVYKWNVKSWNPCSTQSLKQQPGRANPQTRCLKKLYSPLYPFFVFWIFFLFCFVLSFSSLIVKYWHPKKAITKKQSSFTQGDKAIALEPKRSPTSRALEWWVFNEPVAQLRNWELGKEKWMKSAEIWLGGQEEKSTYIYWKCMQF